MARGRSRATRAGRRPLPSRRNRSGRKTSRTAKRKSYLVRSVTRRVSVRVAADSRKQGPSSAAIIHSSTLPGPGPLGDIARALRQSHGLDRVGAGFRIRNGKPTREPCIVVCVDRKIDKRLVPADRLVPPTVEWRSLSGSALSIPTDVLELHPGGYASPDPGVPIMGPGDTITRIRFAGGPPRTVLGTVGAVLQHPEFGIVATTAGHVIEGNFVGQHDFDAGMRPTVRVANAAAGNGPDGFDGEVLRTVVRPYGDYALIKPSDPTRCGNWFEDVTPIIGPTLPSGEDGREPLFVLTARGVRQVTVLHLSIPATVGSNRLAHAIVTTANTRGGDSGACLVDNRGRLWGFVAGFNTTGSGDVVSVFSPAWETCGEEHAVLA